MAIVKAWESGGSSLLDQRIIRTGDTTSGTYTPPYGAEWYQVSLQAGGGSGGAGEWTSSVIYSGGGGGGSGAGVRDIWIPVADFPELDWLLGNAASAQTTPGGNGSRGGSAEITDVVSCGGGYGGKGGNGSTEGDGGAKGGIIWSTTQSLYMPSNAFETDTGGAGGTGGGYLGLDAADGADSTHIDGGQAAAGATPDTRDGGGGASSRQGQGGNGGGYASTNAQSATGYGAGGGGGTPQAGKEAGGASTRGYIWIRTWR